MQLTHSLQVAIAEADDTGDSLADKVRAAMALPKSASLELYLSSDGTPIEAGATLAAQGVGDGAALDVVVSYPPKVWVPTDSLMRAHHYNSRHGCQTFLLRIVHFRMATTPVMVVISFFFLTLLTS